MTVAFSNGLVGLSLLSDTNLFAPVSSSGSSATAASDSRAVRVARAQFVTAATTPPWKIAATASLSVNARVSAIKAMTTIIDKSDPAATANSPDVQTSFTAYKALDRLQSLAQAAGAATASASDRSRLEATFAKGLSDLRSFLTSAPASQLHLSFAQPSIRAQSVAIPQPLAITTSIAGTGVSPHRDDALGGLTGTEKFQVSLSDARGSDTLTVDLATTPQPPTLDSVAAALNAAIAARPNLAADGSAVLDATGNPVVRWATSFVPDKYTGSWGLTLKRSGTEQVSIDQVGASDALKIATGVTTLDAPTATRLLSIADPTGAMAFDTRATVTAAQPTDAASIAAKGKAALAVGAMVTDASGNSYVVGTASGTTGGNIVAGTSDLTISKFDSEGQLLWQHGLGADGTASGVAISLAPDGGVVVAGNVTGTLGTASSDGQMLVARFDATGQEKYATLLGGAGIDKASALSVNADGSVLVGGTLASGDRAMLARIDGTGAVAARRIIEGPGGRVGALLTTSDGAVLAATRNAAGATLRQIDPVTLQDLGSADLGTLDPHALASSGGEIAVGGSANGDGRVVRFSSALSALSNTAIATSATDTVDSLSYLDGQLFAGGTTAGTLAGATRTGAVDGYLARVASDGTIASVSQFGLAGARTESVSLAADIGGNSAVGALGLHRGALVPRQSAELIASTSLRAGDAFSFQVNGGASRSIAVRADDTLTSFAARLRGMVGPGVTVSTPRTGATQALQLLPRTGTSITLLPGRDGSDALSKLGFAPGRLTMPTIRAANAPKVSPGGSFGLGLSTALDLSTAKGASASLAAIKSALSITQTGYRSLYWDAGKAALANGGSSGINSAAAARAAVQLAQYQSALARLTPATTTY